MILDFPDSRILRSKHLLFKLPSLWSSVTAAQTNIILTRIKSPDILGQKPKSLPLNGLLCGKQGWGTTDLTNEAGPLKEELSHSLWGREASSVDRALSWGQEIYIPSWARPLINSTILDKSLNLVTESSPTDTLWGPVFFKAHFPLILLSCSYSSSSPFNAPGWEGFFRCYSRDEKKCDCLSGIST